MKRPRTIFISLLTGSALCALALFFSGEWVLGLLWAFATHMLLLYATLKPSSQWLGPVVTSFQTEKQEVWLTIDDGPDPEETPAVLDLLDRHQAKASFFMVGQQVKAHPDLARLILERGHNIGNHTMNHLEGRFWSLFRGRIEVEINDCSAIIKEVTGVRPQLFRAPVGHKPWPLDKVLQKLKLPLIGWTARGFDGVSKNSDQIVRRIQTHIAPGAIILLHEGRGTLPDTLDKILLGLSDEAYRCVLPSPESFVCGRRKTIR
ncbi:MAG: polysaccharide deacetylase family protein [Verrucomicrobia bacterium]|nr:polysaccharide deacetylase family protein [Verrucomicrobiota bacterium]